MHTSRRSAQNNALELSALTPKSDTDDERIDTHYFDDDDDEDLDVHAGLLHEQQPAYPNVQPAWVQKVLDLLPLPNKGRQSIARRRLRSISNASLFSRVCLVMSGLLLAIVLITAVLFPSYTSPPPRYTALRKRIESSSAPGAGNIDNQKVFIAASIFDPGGELAGGKWGECVLGLIHILGPENVYLSIYENDAGTEAELALMGLKEKIQCAGTLRFDEHLGFEEVAHVSLPDGSERVKRITYLSEARNRALLPLQSSKIRYDKLLYLNDVVFNPVEIAQLLFLTGAAETSSASYRAACAVDFINPVKYYDTFATRDIEGYGIGLPFFPWFTTAGHGESRKQVLSGSDAISVRSCWGGAVAFDARFFQTPNSGVGESETAAAMSPANRTAPYGFRAEDDLFWEASECCLIHADIQEPDLTRPSGILMNPYVRTAYDWNTLQWLAFSRRFERLYTPAHWIITKMVGMPWRNPRKDEKPWNEVTERVWTGRAFEEVTRVAGHSGFCGRRGLQLMKMDRSSGGRPWEEYPVPGS